VKNLLEPIEIGKAPGRLPIRCFTGTALLPDQAARRQLADLAVLPGLDHSVTVLPDVHFKSRNPAPTGTVVVSGSMLVPRAVDPGLNCGMRIVATSVPARELTPERLDALFGRLIEAIPIEPRPEALLDNQACERLLVEGLPAVAGALEVTEADLGRVENGGRMTPRVRPDVIRSVVTDKAIRRGNLWLGTLGAGNHFLELQEIVDVLDAAAAGGLGLVKGDAVFMMHTDSRKLGKLVLRPVLEEALGVLGNGHVPDSLWAIPADSAIGGRFVAALSAATHAGFANRSVLTQILRRVVRTVLGDPSLVLPLVFDCGHESIQRETHAGESLWVHRHGASHALPASAFPADPVLGTVGQPVPVPGSMGSDSFIGVTRPGVAETFHSVAHGAGRVIEKVRAAERFDPAEVEREVRTGGVRLYRYGTDNIAGQAPRSFKDVRGVVEAMAAFDLIRPVVRLRPFAVLKG
jgi:tRNA-splicing ligase RtcB